MKRTQQYLTWSAQYLPRPPRAAWPWSFWSRRVLQRGKTGARRPVSASSPNARGTSASGTAARSAVKESRIDAEAERETIKVERLHELSTLSRRPLKTHSRAPPTWAGLRPRPQRRDGASRAPARACARRACTATRRVWWTGPLESRPGRNNTDDTVPRLGRLSERIETESYGLGSNKTTLTGQGCPGIYVPPYSALYWRRGSQK